MCRRQEAEISAESIPYASHRHQLYGVPASPSTARYPDVHAVKPAAQIPRGLYRG